MATKLLDGVAATGNSNSLELGETVNGHCLEFFITDANTSITAIVVDLFVRCAKGPEADVPFSTAKQHTFTAQQLTDLQAKVNVFNEPATEIKIGISTLTGAGAGDSIDGWYHPLPINK